MLQYGAPQYLQSPTEIVLYKSAYMYCFNTKHAASATVTVYCVYVAGLLQHPEPFLLCSIRKVIVMTSGYGLIRPHQYVCTDPSTDEHG